jgi:hypothetical protein
MTKPDIYVPPNNIPRAAIFRKLVTLVTETGRTWEMHYKGIVVTARPGDTEADVEQSYQTAAALMNAHIFAIRG